jgi:hypothetical protein
MRYLYGDSVPFPPQYDFLAVLEAFCVQAPRVVRLDAEAWALRKSAEEAAVTRQRALEELDVFHRETLGALREAANHSTQPLVHDYVRQVVDLAARIAEDAKGSAVSTSDRDSAQSRAECDKRRAEVRDALEKLFVAVRLPVADTQVTMTLVDGRNDMSASFAYEGGIFASFTLAAGDVSGWSAPHHVREFAQNVTLPVGVRRSLFKRTVAPETIALDEYLISGFDLKDDRAEIRLRRRAQEPDSLVFTLQRVEDKLTAEVHYPDDAMAQSLPAALDHTSAIEIERLWQLLRRACAPVLTKKKRMVRLVLGGNDVFENDLGGKVISHIVSVIAPIVAEVAKRSPNVDELSLKVENDAGRREEIYLRKAQLVSALSSVTPRERGVFDPLGLIASVPHDPDESEDVTLAMHAPRISRPTGN